jgi:hypothetical protein
VNYLTSTKAAEEFFRAAYAALKPGGLLLFDVSSRYKLSSVLGNNLFAQDDGDIAYIWRNAYDETSKLLEMNLTFYVREGGTYRRFAETHIQRAHSQRELEGVLYRVGFVDIHVYTAFTREKPADTCERIQFVAKRPE